MFEATLPSIHISHYGTILCRIPEKYIKDIFNHNGTGYYKVKLPLYIRKGFVMLKINQFYTKKKLKLMYISLMEFHLN